METKRTLQPGKPGTMKYVKQYGESLVCIRYRYDETKHLSYTTVELIVENSICDDSVQKLSASFISEKIIIGTNDAEIVETENASVLGTNDVEIVETENASVLGTNDAAVVETNDIIIGTKDEASIKEIRNAANLPEKILFVRIEYGELELRKIVRAAGGKWNPERKLWELASKDVVAVGLANRVVEFDTPHVDIDKKDSYRDRITQIKRKSI